MSKKLIAGHFDEIVDHLLQLATDPGNKATKNSWPELIKSMFIYILPILNY